MSLLIRIVGVLVVAFVLAGLTLWAFGAIFYSSAWASVTGKAAAAVLVATGAWTIAALVVTRWRLSALVAYGAALVLFFGWWNTIEPSNDRDWKPEVALLPEVSRDGDRFTVRNVRNFSYRTTTDFTPAYYDETYDLNDLQSVDLIASYWSGPDIAHIFVSFGFTDDRYLAVSVERRDELGEGYSTVKGLFKQYELFYVVADERDVLRLRTNVRSDPPEDVYVYRIGGPTENGQRLFVEYMKRVEELGREPEFYNTLTSNCAGNVWLNAHVNPGRMSYSWKILLSGHVPEMLYERGMLNTSMPFDDLQRMSRVNDAAIAAGDSPDFSRQIRNGLPTIMKP